jgi:protein-tyrosine phosphatase
MRERGLDLTQHESQPLSDRLVRFADLILTMTRGHREAIAAQWPEAAARTELLCRGHGDVADPIGGPLEVYRRCAEQIDSHLAPWIRGLDFCSVPKMVESGE